MSEPGGTQPAAVDASAGTEFDEARWLPALRLPCRLTVELPVPQFRVTDLLNLSAGELAATELPISKDLPLKINGTLIGWGEFEAVHQRLAVRVTQLA